MTNAIPIRIADAVVSQINGHTFATTGFTAVRSSGSWDKDFKGLDQLSVDVVIRKTGIKMVLLSQGKINYYVDIVIAVRHRFDVDDRNQQTGELKVTAVDPLDTLVVDIAELFISRRNATLLDSETNAILDTQAIEPKLSNEERLRKGMYYGLVIVPFRYSKAI